MSLYKPLRGGDLLWNYEPFRHTGQFQKQFDRIFDDLSNEAAVPTAWMPDTYVPSAEIQETENHYVLSMDVPGMKKDDLKIELRGNQLWISGERKEEQAKKKKGMYRSERYYGAFQRCFTLPEEVKAEHLVADYKDGVLHVAVPKVEAAHAQQIKIGESKPGFFDRLLKRDQKALDNKDANRVA